MICKVLPDWVLEGDLVPDAIDARGGSCEPRLGCGVEHAQVQGDVRVRSVLQRPLHCGLDVGIRGDEDAQELPEGVWAGVRQRGAAQELGSCGAHGGVGVFQEELDCSCAGGATKLQHRRGESGPIVANAARLGECGVQNVGVHDERAVVIRLAPVDRPQLAHLPHRESLVGKL